MITTTRRCDVCSLRALVRYSGDRWLCRICWNHLMPDEHHWRREPGT